MRTIQLIALSIGILALGLCYSHLWPVHEQITDSAVKSSVNLQTFLADYNLANQMLFTSTPEGDCDVTPPTPSAWLQFGSKEEDTAAKRRCLNHFYTVEQPTRTAGEVHGLTDWSEPPLIAHILAAVGEVITHTTTNSFKWATDDNVQGPGGYVPNAYKWDDARRYEIAGLTNTTLDARNTSMAIMFYSLGHVLHLNQDDSAPDHVRNAAHLYQAFFEKYGRDHWETNSQWFVPPSHDQPGWVYWQAQGFTKLLDFWDRNYFNHNSADGLIADALSENRIPLGLAEFCNGNFLGQTALYTECNKPGGKHYFPFPSLANTTTKNLNPHNLAGSLGLAELRNHKTGDRVRISKTGAGIDVTYHSVLNYLGIQNTPRLAQMKVAITVNDNNVFQEYHDKIIPKAAEYSAGILDYFFRGTMEVKVVGYDTNSLHYTNLIVNTSGQDFGSGTYSAYYDDTNDVRTLIGQTNRLGTLPDGESLKMTMRKPESFPRKFLLVYRGSIGVDGNGAAFDLVDSNICLAAKSFSITNEQIKTYYYWQPTNVVGTAITNTLESDDFDFTPTAGHFEVFINIAQFDDTGTIGEVKPNGGLCCTFTNEISNVLVPAERVTVVGNRLSVKVTATDDPNCGENIGWWTNAITWRAWPAP